MNPSGPDKARLGSRLERRKCHPTGKRRRGPPRISGITETPLG